jgi:3-methyl-2-oxobutanoate hydroxymethyltransferase
MVLELVPASLAESVSRAVSVPTIGIGAGPGCDGQVLVLHDMLGLNEGFNPKFLKLYADLATTVRAAAGAFATDVRSGRYPGKEHSFE